MTRVSGFSDLRESQPVPEIALVIDRLGIIKYCGAADDYAYVHWDYPRITGQGFPDLVVQGWLTFAHMCRAVTRWIPLEIADVVAYAVRYNKPTFPGAVTVGGNVARISNENGARQAELALWAKDAKGQVTTSATMTLRFV